MLVVAPIAILSIAAILSLTISVVGDALIAQDRATSSFTTQDALDRIEQDIRLSSAFLSSFSVLQPGQGKNATEAGPTATDTTTFATSGSSSENANTLILNQTATTLSPLDPARSLIYYADQPNACNASNTYLNRPLSPKVIYFLRDDGLGSKTLWRRVVVPSWNTDGSVPMSKVCNTPWQRDTCPKANLPDCQAVDERMLDNVSALNLTYYAASGSATTDSRSATNVKVLLSVSRKVAGSVINTSGTLRATRTNDTVDTVPVAPTLSTLNPSVNVDNNPTRITFGWPPVASAGYYNISYTINGGSPVTATTIATSYVVSAKPNDNVSITVTAVNDMGSSAPATHSATLPLWTAANLEGGSACTTWQSTYDCVSYTKVSPTGVVMLRGLVTDSSIAAGDTIFTLPLGCRPSKQLVFPVVGSTNGTDVIAGRIDVRTDGRVTYEAPTGNNVISFLSLSDIRFLASDAPTAWSNATPVSANGWVHYGGAYGNIQYNKDAVGRTYLYGLVKGGTTVAIGTGIVSLPSGYFATTPGIFPGLSNNAYTVYQLTTSASQAQARNMGSTGASAWTAMAAMYFSTTSSVAQNALSLSSPWSNYSASYNSAQYAKPSDKIVTLRGLIKGGNTGMVGTLPASYRPGKQMTFLTVGINSVGTQVVARIEVNPAGVVSVINGNNNLSTSWLSLENISFYQEN